MGAKLHNHVFASISDSRRARDVRARTGLGVRLLGMGPLLLWALGSASLAWAQHEGHDHPPAGSSQGHPGEGSVPKSPLPPSTGTGQAVASKPFSAPAFPTLIPSGTKLEKPPAGQEPKVVFSALEHDFGPIDDGAVKSTDVTFKNQGKGPLMILNVRPSCACTLGGIEVEGKPYNFGEPILPGQSGILKIAMRATGFSGEKTTQVDVVTNDPSLPPTFETPFGQVTIKVKGKGVRAFEFENFGQIDIGSVRMGTEVERSVVLRSTKGVPFQITDIQGRDDMVEWTAEAVDAKAVEWRLKAKLSPKIPAGMFARQVMVLINIPGSQPIPAMIRGRIRGSVDLEPPSGLSFKIVPLGQEQKLTLKVKCDADRTPLKLKQPALCDPRDFVPSAGGTYNTRPNLQTPRPMDEKFRPHLSATLREVEPDSSFEIDVRVLSTMPAGSFSAMMLIETGLPDGPNQIAVPITGFVK